ncbi:MAG: hypothetical protein A2169_12435 [Deltaproteobacteria bacterium RBG_13_47_9]|nr:MAG: hypothetical protein A2169_12435 [Deltaproteobacteria bacterium RBG_13_47_9]
MDSIVTKTLAEIYLKQGHLREAYEILKALSKRDPSDTDVLKRLNELDEKLGLTLSSIQSLTPLNREKIRLLESWLANIQKRKRV